MKTIIIMATTLDGKIAKSSDHFTNWTSKEDKDFFISETKKAGVIVMGSATFATFKKPLPDRLNIILTKNVSEMEAKYQISNNLKFTDLTPEEILGDIENDGHSCVIIGGGAKVNSLFLKSGLVDEIYITIEPKIFGKGISIFDDQDFDIDLELISTENLNKNTVLLKYKVL